MGSLAIIDGSKLVGDTEEMAGGRIVANLTMKNLVQGTQYMFSSTLTISPPLDNVRNTNLDNTTVTCGGSGTTGVTSGDLLYLCMVSSWPWIVLDSA